MIQSRQAVSTRQLDPRPRNRKGCLNGKMNIVTNSISNSDELLCLASDYPKMAEEQEQTFQVQKSDCSMRKINVQGRDMQTANSKYIRIHLTAIHQGNELGKTLQKDLKQVFDVKRYLYISITHNLLPHIQIDAMSYHKVLILIFFVGLYSFFGNDHSLKWKHLSLAFCRLSSKTCFNISLTRFKRLSSSSTTSIFRTLLILGIEISSVKNIPPV